MSTRTTKSLTIYASAGELCGALLRESVETLLRAAGRHPKDRQLQQAVKSVRRKLFVDGQGVFGLRDLHLASQGYVETVQDILEDVQCLLAKNSSAVPEVEALDDAIDTVMEVLMVTRNGRCPLLVRMPIGEYIDQTSVG